MPELLLQYSESYFFFGFIRFRFFNMVNSNERRRNPIKINFGESNAWVVIHFLHTIVLNVFSTEIYN